MAQAILFLFPFAGGFEKVTAIPRTAERQQEET